MDNNLKVDNKESKKLYIIAFRVCILGMLSSVKYFFETPFNEENGHTRWMYIIVLALLLIHSWVIIRITQVTKRTNKKKIEVIEDEQGRIEKLTDKIIGIGMKVKISTFETNKLVNDLNKAIKEKTHSNVCGHLNAFFFI